MGVMRSAHRYKIRCILLHFFLRDPPQKKDPVAFRRPSMAARARVTERQRRDTRLRQ